MQARHLLLCLSAATLWTTSAMALDASLPASSSNQFSKRGTFGLNPARSRAGVPCGVTSLGCDLSDNSVKLYSAPLVGKFWGVELGYLDQGNISRGGALSRTQGLNASLVGRASIASSWGVFSKLGTTWGRTEALGLPASPLAAPGNRGFGMAFVAGVSYEFTPRLSATLAWEGRELRLGPSGHEPVSSTSLGLQYRY